MDINKILASYRWTHAEEGATGVLNKTKILAKRQADGIKASLNPKYTTLQKNIRSDGFYDVCFINGCSYDLPHPIRYRVDHQIEQLRAAGYTSLKFDGEPNEDLLRHARLFIIYRFPYSENISNFIKQAKALNRCVLFDIDDLVIDTEYTNNIPFIQNMTVKDKELYDSGVIRMGKTLRLCDGAITTTESLAAELEKFVPKVYVNRNTASDEMVYFSNLANYRRDTLPSISRDKLNVQDREIQKIWMQRNEEASNFITIGYFSGSITHNDDFDIILPTIVALMEAFPQVRLLIGGELDIPQCLEKFKSRIKTFPFCSWRELPFHIAQCDINITPLVNTLFNSAKSENKWIEAALVKVPTIASRVGAFEHMIKDGETGLLCSNEDEWMKAFIYLIENADARRKLGNTAYNYVIENCTTIKSAQSIKNIVDTTITPNFAFVLPSTDISGGVLVALKHAAILQQSGNDVYLIDDDKNASWVNFEDSRFPVLNKHVNNSHLDNCPFEGRFDTLIATLWSTVEFCTRYPNCYTRKYLVQGYETDFNKAGYFPRFLTEATYHQVPNLEYITISKWCLSWLQDKYSNKVKFAMNGINIEQFKPTQRDFSSKKIRILIEGNCESANKNIDEAFEITNGLDKSRYEIWYMNYTGKTKKYYQIDNFLGSVDPKDVANIYRDCHILLKTSLLESFSYPPLEMIATGGFVVACPNDGNKEILSNKENCLLYEAGNIIEARLAIERISTDECLRNKLYKNGQTTANSRDWNNLTEDILKLYK